MAQQERKEKRTYIRAELATRVKIQPVSREEFERHKSMTPVQMPGGLSEENGGLLESGLGCLLERMNRIEEKIDRILWKLDPEERPDEISSYGTAQNVSGAGINLILEEAFDEGQLVLISLSIPGFSIGFLEAYGEVVRVAPFNDNNRQSFETSIKFLIISEEEREKLISYAFSRQRQAIRDSQRAKERDQDLPNDGG